MPLMSWAAHVLQWRGQWAATARAGANPKTAPQFGLEAATRLHEVGVELLVIADQHAAVNAFPGLVHTARHTTRVVCTRSRRPNPRGGEVPKVWRVRGVKS